MKNVSDVLSDCQNSQSWSANFSRTLDAAIDQSRAMERLVQAYDAYDKSWDDKTKTRADVIQLEIALEKALTDWRKLTKPRDSAVTTTRTNEQT